MNSIYTIVCGVAVYALSQIFLEFVIKPLQDFKQLKGDIAYQLVYYANYYGNPKAEYIDGGVTLAEATVELRKIASKTLAFAQFNYHILGIPSKKVFLQVEGALIGLSNGCNKQGESKDNNRYCNEIYSLLRIN